MSVQITYLPGSDTDRVVWLNNFSMKIGIYAALLGITAAEVSDVQKDAAYFQYIVQLVEFYKNTLPHLIAYKKLLRKAAGQQQLSASPQLPQLPPAPPSVPEGVFDRLSRLVKRIKASANYTEHMGQDLGIVAARKTYDLYLLQPSLKIRLDAGHPRIRSSKGIAHAIDLYADRGDGNGFVFMARVMHPNYLDETELPPAGIIAEWKYKAQFVMADKPVGLMSKEMNVLVRKV